MQQSKLLLALLTVFSAVAISFSSLRKDEVKTFHTLKEREQFARLNEGKPLGPIEPGQYFLTSGHCKGCHGYDTTHLANVDANGVDINLYDDWETSMMANSAKDPLWRAKVSHEILINPGHAEELQTKCTSCHAPMGHFTAVFHGETYYTLTDLYADTLGLNGVSCGSCHMISPQNLGTTFSGDLRYDTSKVEYGPFGDPFVGPMQLYEGLTPEFSDHMFTSQVCSGCHTLITKSVDLNGNFTGNTFVEQATFHEWLNSVFSQDDGKVCQTCHMPQIEDGVIIANNILALDPRSPFNQHQFAGGNYFMVNLIKQNKDSLGITAPDVNFDSTLAATYRMLTQQSLDVQLNLDSISTDTAFLSFRITNNAGHKFPSGYPSRRAVVQLIVTTTAGDTVFQSGVFDSNNEVKNIDAAYETHYNVISDPHQVQIYEMIMGDVNGDVTTVLERADQLLKDNRIPPEGFVTNSPVYDTVQIAGSALDDPDFNKTNNTEGSGRDIVHYHIALDGISGPLNLYAKVLYQSVPPRWVEDMFNYSSNEIDAFRQMYLAADGSPIVAAHDSLLNINLPTLAAGSVTPAALSVISVPGSGLAMIENSGAILIYAATIYGTDGKKGAAIAINSQSRSIPISLPANGGIYLIELTTDQGRFVYKIFNAIKR
ncbi:MAG: hypothetical protein K1X63_11510 [Chitinophagales bacterium]|nr:hypothetical protein [Chitinophagales bacterium]